MKPHGGRNVVQLAPNIVLGWFPRRCRCLTLASRRCEGRGRGVGWSWGGGSTVLSSAVLCCVVECVCVLQPPLSFVVCCVICSSVLLFLFLCRFSAVLFVLFSCLDDVVLALVVLPLIVAVAGSLQTHTDRGTRAHTHTGMAGWCFLFCCFVLDRQCNFPLHIFPSAHTRTCSLRMF